MLFAHCLTFTTDRAASHETPLVNSIAPCAESAVRRIRPKGTSHLLYSGPAQCNTMGATTMHLALAYRGAPVLRRVGVVCSPDLNPLV